MSNEPNAPQPKSSQVSRDASRDVTGDPPPQVSAQLVATAIHEAGHAVMATLLGRSIQKVTIAPGRMQSGDVRLGICEMKKGRVKASKDAVEDDVLILLAGMVAEARFTGQYCHEGAAQDLRAVKRLLENRAGSEQQLQRLQRRMLAKTEHLLHDEANARAVQRVANELLQRTTISGRAVRHLFDQAT